MTKYSELLYKDDFTVNQWIDWQLKALIVYEDQTCGNISPSYFEDIMLTGNINGMVFSWEGDFDEDKTLKGLLARYHENEIDWLGIVLLDIDQDKGETKLELICSTGGGGQVLRDTLRKLRHDKSQKYMHLSSVFSAMGFYRKIGFQFWTKGTTDESKRVTKAWTKAFGETSFKPEEVKNNWQFSPRLDKFVDKLKSANVIEKKLGNKNIFQQGITMSISL